jgi:hypothetical protein
MYSQMQLEQRTGTSFHPDARSSQAVPCEQHCQLLFEFCLLHVEERQLVGWVVGMADFAWLIERTRCSLRRLKIERCSKSEVCFNAASGLILHIRFETWSGKCVMSGEVDGAAVATGDF